MALVARGHRGNCAGGWGAGGLHAAGGGVVAASGAGGMVDGAGTARLACGGEASRTYHVVETIVFH